MEGVFLQVIVFLFLLSQMSTMLQKNILWGAGDGGCLQKFWLSLGSNARVVSILQETHAGEVVTLKAKNLDPKRESYLLSQAIHVPDMALDSHRETGSVGATLHEASPLALEKSLACARSFGEDHSSTQVTPSPPGLMAGQGQCVVRPTTASSLSRSAAVYRCIKRRWWGGGGTLRGLQHKKHLVTTRKQVAHKFPRIEGSFSGPQGVQAFMQESDSVSGHGQHHSCCLHKQGRRYEIRLSLCPPLETALLVQSQANSTEDQAHTRSSECDSGQVVQASTSDPNRVVPPTRGVQPPMFKMAHSSGGSVCHQI